MPKHSDYKLIKTNEVPGYLLEGWEIEGGPVLRGDVPNQVVVKRAPDEMSTDIKAICASLDRLTAAIEAVKL